MARPLRLEFPGALYHLTARGNAQQEIYLDDIDRAHFLDLLEREINQQRWHCYAYCLMGNHYHLLLETPEANLSKGMRRLNGVYSQWFNHRHERVGHLFQGRYKSIFVDKDSYLLELSRYIVLNPVRANLVKRPWDWKWSSYLATVGSIESPSWLSSSSILRQFGRNKEKSQKNFKRFVEEGLVTKSPWDNLHGQIWLGSENFREKMENELKGKTFDNIPVIQTMPLRPTKEDVINVVSEAYHVNHEAIFDRSVKSAYRACVYLLRRAANLSLKEVSEICGISPSRISQIQREIEANKSDKHLNGLAKKYKVKN